MKSSFWLSFRTFQTVVPQLALGVWVDYHQSMFKNNDAFIKFRKTQNFQLSYNWKNVSF